MKFKRLLYLVCILLILSFGIRGVNRYIYYHEGVDYKLAVANVFREIRQFIKSPSQGSSQDSKKEPLPVELDSYINHPSQITKLFPKFIESTIAFGNTPYQELLTEASRSIVKDQNGHLINLPNQKYKFAFLRSRIFQNWDPIVLKQNNLHTPISPEVDEFIKKYCLKSIIVSTDENGDRNTVPKINSDKIILIIGDSVAFGVGVSDSETLASKLQQKYQGYRFINASVGNADAKDNIARLRERAELYKNKVRGVIYVHCENDFSKIETPEYIVSELSSLLDKFKINFRVFVYQVYSYRAMPDLLRHKKEEELVNYYNLKARTLELAQKAGFRVVDFYNIVENYRYEMGTPYAGFSLYEDHCHFSELGITLVANQIIIPNNL